MSTTGFLCTNVKYAEPQSCNQIPEECPGLHSPSKIVLMCSNARRAFASCRYFCNATLLEIVCRKAISWSKRLHFYILSTAHTWRSRQFLIGTTTTRNIMYLLFILMDMDALNTDSTDAHDTWTQPHLTKTPKILPFRYTIANVIAFHTGITKKFIWKEEDSGSSKKKTTKPDYFVC